MNYKVCELSTMEVSGMRISLTTSFASNMEASIQHWKTFNQEIENHHLQQNQHWIKYGVTLRMDDALSYLCAIPKTMDTRGFPSYTIEGGTFLVFQHTGAMHNLKQSISEIFQKFIPNSSFSLRNTPLVYFEKYTSSFRYNHPDSIIEIYVPIQPIHHTSIDFIPIKSMLQTKKGYASSAWFGIDYNINIYKGCSHGCIYCDSRSNCYHIENFDTVRSKAQALHILESELKRKRKKGVIGIGAMSDTYNPFERTYEITRQALKLIERYGFGVALATKSDLVVRDIDILARIAKQYPTILQVSITCADDALSNILEPHVCASSKRFLAVQQLSEAGIYTGILLMPILPFINDTIENIKQIVYLAHIHKATFIYAMFGVTLRENQRDYYYQCLDTYFPGKRELYETYYQNSYSCMSFKAKALYEVFEAECITYGILYKMEDIINGYKHTLPNEQLHLF